MSAISTDGMDKWLDDAYPDLDRRKANMIYEIASLIKDDPDTAPVPVSYTHLTLPTIYSV